MREKTREKGGAGPATGGRTRRRLAVADSSAVQSASASVVATSVMGTEASGSAMDFYTLEASLHQVNMQRMGQNKEINPASEKRDSRNK